MPLYHAKCLQKCHRHHVSSPESAPELLKNPVIAEFLGISPNVKYSEIELESAIINHLQSLLMEIGKGFAFMERQQLIRTGAERN